MIQTCSLPNGIRIVTETVENVRKASITCTMTVGSTCEPRQLNGLAHCMEHAFFLGGKTFDEKAIKTAERQLGCNFNAETHQEKISLLAEVLPEDLSMALTVLADMMQFPAFPEKAFEREKEAIYTEIAEVQDDDENFAGNMIHATAFKRDPLGMPIEGSAKTIKQITPQALRAFHNTYFRPENLIISVAGAVNHESFVQLCTQLFGQFKNDNPTPDYPQSRYFGGDMRVESNGDMDLFRIAYQSVPFNPYREYMCSEIFASILEDALYDELRDKSGLLYCVRADNYTFTNQAMFVVSGTCYPQKFGTVIQKACECIMRTKNNLTPEQIAMAQKRIKLDLTANDGILADRAASNVFDLQYFGRLMSLDETYRILDSITLDEVKTIASAIIGSRMAFSGLGHTHKMPRYDQITHWLRVADEQTKPVKVAGHIAQEQVKINNNQLTK